MINTIILDIGNVMVHFRWDEVLRDYGFNEDIIRRIGNVTVQSATWSEWDRGARDENELMLECCNNDPGIAAEVKIFFNLAAKWVKEYDYSADFVKLLKANGYKVYLLSNYSRGSFKYVKEDFNFYKYVDGGVISYEVNYIKPEPEIYEELIRKYNINPKEAVFLDDSQANLDGAKPFGFHTILVTEFEKALGELRTLGVRV